MILAWLLLLAASSLVLLAMFAAPEVNFLLPLGYSLPAPLFLGGIAICGLIVGFSLYAIFIATMPSATAVAIGTAFVLGAGLIATIWHSGDSWVAWLALIALIGVAAIEGVRREIGLFGDYPQEVTRRLPLWGACTALIIFVAVALLGDAAPARTGMGLCLGAGALAVAFVAVRGMQGGDVLEVTTWSGGIGGGRAGFRISRATAQLLLALVLAGAAAASLATPTPAPKNKTETAQERIRWQATK